MATMFFAGIPLEGSGGRPLEADLYGAEQQATDAENISATGNLNIGNVIAYDEHVQRYLSGGIKGEEATDTPTSLSNPEMRMSELASSAGTPVMRGGNYTGEVPTATNTAPTSDTQSAAQSYLARANGGADAAPTSTGGYSNQSSLGTNGGGDTSTTNTTRSSSSSSSSSTDSHNVTNNTTTNNYTYTNSSVSNTTTNATQNNYYNDNHSTNGGNIFILNHDSHNSSSNTSLINIGNITIGGHHDTGNSGGNGGGSTTTNFISTTLSEVRQRGEQHGDQHL